MGTTIETKQLVTIREQVSWGAQPQLGYLWGNCYRYGSGEAAEGVERWWKPEAQNICCETVSSGRDKDAAPMKSQHVVPWANSVQRQHQLTCQGPSPRDELQEVHGCWERVSLPPPGMTSPLNCPVPSSQLRTCRAEVNGLSRLYRHVCTYVMCIYNNNN